MANFENLLKDIQEASNGISGMATQLNETTKYSEGLVRSLSDLSTMGTTKGSIWSAIGRFSSGNFFFIQKQLRGITVAAKVLTNLEKERLARVTEANEQLEKNAQSYEEIYKSVKNIGELRDSSNARLKEILTLTNSQNRLMLRQKGFLKFIGEQEETSLKNIRAKLKIERDVVANVKTYNELTGRNVYGLDMAKDALRDSSVLDKSVQVGGGGFLGSSDIESFAVQIAGISEEFSMLDEELKKQRKDAESFEKRRKTQLDKIKEETKQRDKQNELLRNNKQLLYDANQELQKNQRRQKEIEKTIEGYTVNDRGDSLMNASALAARDREIEKLTAEMQGLTLGMEDIQENIGSYNTLIEAQSQEAERLNGVIEKRQTLIAEDGRLAKSQLDARKETIKIIENEKLAREEVFNQLTEEAKESRIEVEGGVGAVTKISRRKAEITRGKVLKSALLPITSLVENAKNGLLSYFDKRNINKQVQFAKAGLMVFAKVLYGITLLALLVFVLHQSGFIDRVGKFIEKHKDIIADYISFYKELGGAIWDFLTSFYGVISALFRGNTEDLKESLSNLLGASWDILKNILKIAAGSIVLGLSSVIMLGVNALISTIQLAAGLLGAKAKEVGQKAGEYLPAFGVVSGMATGAKLGMAGGVPGVIAGIALGAAIGGVGGLAAKSISGLSTGGTVSTGGLFMVGEKGPELVHLPAGSAVYNNQQTRGMMGGNTINVHVNGRVGASDAELDDIARKIGRKINLEMNRYNNSGYRA